MWPYTDQDLAYFDRLAAETAVAPPPAEYSADCAQFYVARARSLRGVMLRLAVQRICDRLFHFGRPVQPKAQQAHKGDALFAMVTDR